jgi:uncharacterized protein YgiM (DUF1202 family)
MHRTTTRWVLALTVIAIFLIPATWSLAETLYIIAKSAHIRAGKTSLDAVTETVRFGDAVESIARDNEWVQIRTKNGATGWIYAANKLSTTPPASDQGYFEKMSASLKGPASATTTSAGARGLDKVAQGYAEDNGIAPQHRQAVDDMTNYTLDDARVDTFLKEGGLGEYKK